MFTQALGVRHHRLLLSLNNLRLRRSACLPEAGMRGGLVLCIIRFPPHREACVGIVSSSVHTPRRHLTIAGQPYAAPRPLKIARRPTGTSQEAGRVKFGEVLRQYGA